MFDLFDLFGHGSAIEAAYWSNLEAQRRSFAADVVVLLPDLDLIIDPPSIGVLHRPFLSAILDAYPAVPWLYFLKNQSVQSSFANLPAMRAAIAGPRLGSRPFPKKKPDIKNVLLVDDVFSEGNVASIVIDMLIADGLANASFFIASPLRVP